MRILRVFTVMSYDVRISLVIITVSSYGVLILKLKRKEIMVC